MIISLRLFILDNRSMIIVVPVESMSHSSKIVLMKTTMIDSYLFVVCVCVSARGCVEAPPGVTLSEPVCRRIRRRAINSVTIRSSEATIQDLPPCLLL